MTIEESRRYLERITKWHVNDATFQVIEKETCTWVAEMTTTHLEENEAFFILVHYTDYFIIEQRWRHKLAAWFGEYL